MTNTRAGSRALPAFARSAMGSVRRAPRRAVYYARSVRFGIVHLAGFPAAFAAGAGCGTVLVLEEPAPVPTGPDGAVLPPGGDASIPDVPDLPDASCNLAACGPLGGSCDSGACRVDCTKGCEKGRVIDCPPGSDCQIVCGKDQCDGLQCRGGRCTFECAGSGACKNAACSGEACTFRCREAESCKDVLHCDGGSCTAECSGEKTCVGDKGIDFEGATSCTIECTGAKSCTSSANPELRCGASPRSTIVCSGLDACKESLPSCDPPSTGSCSVTCLGGTCEEGACCGNEDRCVFVGVKVESCN
jgi:hypothetical protein